MLVILGALPYKRFMDSISLLRFFFAFAFVLSLMWLLSIAMKRFGYGKLMTMQKDKRRLKLVEYLPLDSRNRLVLVSQDDKEHLLLLNAEHSQIVKTDITPVKPTSGDTA